LVCLSCQEIVFDGEIGRDSNQFFINDENFQNFKRNFMSKVSVANQPGNSNETSYMEEISRLASQFNEEFDIDLENEILFVQEQVATRNLSNLSESEQENFKKVISYQGQYRYFQLINDAIQTMGSIFTKTEMVTILNANCAAVAQINVYNTVAGMVADDLEIEDPNALSDDSTAKILLKKLSRLTVIQNVALIDVCERFFRSKGDDSFHSKLSGMNFELLESGV
jgi:hypothetical protein